MICQQSQKSKGFSAFQIALSVSSVIVVMTAVPRASCPVSRDSSCPTVNPSFFNNAEDCWNLYSTISLKWGLNTWKPVKMNKVFFPLSWGSSFCYGYWCLPSPECNNSRKPLSLESSKCQPGIIMVLTANLASLWFFSAISVIYVTHSNCDLGFEGHDDYYDDCES